MCPEDHRADFAAVAIIGADDLPPRRHGLAEQLVGPGWASAGRDVDGEAALAGFLVALTHVLAGLPHRSRSQPSDTLWRAVALHRQARRRSPPSPPPKGVALDAGDLLQPGTPGSQVISEVMLERDLGGILRPAPGCCPWRAKALAAARRRGRAATSPWQPTSAPEIEALCLMMPPMAAAVRRHVVDAGAEAPASNCWSVFQHGG